MYSFLTNYLSLLLSLFFSLSLSFSFRNSPLPSEMCIHTVSYFFGYSPNVVTTNSTPTSPSVLPQFGRRSLAITLAKLTTDQKLPADHNKSNEKLLRNRSDDFLPISLERETKSTTSKISFHIPFELFTTSSKRMSFA